MEDFAIVSQYSRADAIQDGVLVDITDLAKEYGIAFPVAMTEAAYNKCVAVPEHAKGLQDETGRTWDVLTMLRHAITPSTEESELRFSVLVNNNHGQSKYLHQSHGAMTQHLKALCHPGDQHEPVITIMLPNED